MNCAVSFPFFNPTLTSSQVGLLQKAFQALSLVDRIRTESDVLSASVGIGLFGQSLVSASKADMAILSHLAEAGQVPNLDGLHVRFQNALLDVRRYRGLTA